MGKRRKAKKPAKPASARRQQKLDTTFNCLFCNHDNSVTCKLDKSSGLGFLSCKVCGQSHQCRINSLSAPIDVYSDWIDASELLNTRQGASLDVKNTRSRIQQPEDIEDEEDDDYD